MKKNHYFPTIIVALALLIGAGVGWGLEWAEEVQMTHGGENNLDTRYHIGVAVDRNDVIHLTYTYGSWEEGNHGQNDQQPVYQQFSKTGEPLIDPIVIGEIYDHFDTVAYSFDLCLDADENVHILWGSDTLYHTMFANNGEPIIPGVRMQGLLRRFAWDYCPPKITVDSQGNLIYFGDTCTPWDPEEMSRDKFISYGRYTFEGELIDTLHYLQVDPRLGRYPHVLCAPGDTLHFSWMDNRRWLYSKVSPDDEILIDKQFITGEGDEDNWFKTSNLVISDGGNINSLTENYNVRHSPEYFIQLSPDFQWNFQIYLGDNELGDNMQRIWDGGDLGAFIVADTYLPPYENQLIYTRISYDGEIIDSAQCIRRSFLAGGGVMGWNSMSILGFSDSTVAIIWDDNRFSDSDIGDEMFMRYSLPAGQAVVEPQPLGPFDHSLISVNPNPFNGTVVINCELPRPDRYVIKIYNMTGQEVWSHVITAAASGICKTQWKGEDANGCPLPSGSYICELSSKLIRETTTIQYVK